MKYLLYLTTLVAVFTDAVNCSFAQNTSTKNKNNLIMIDTMVTNHAQIIREIYNQALNKRKAELLKEFISDDFIGVRGLKGPKGFEEPVKILINAFPDIQWNIEDVITDGDKVVVKWKWHGTHLAQFQNFMPTGKTMTNEGVGIFEFEDRKIVKADIQTDRLGFLQQLEVVPLDINQLANTNHSGRVSLIDRFFVPKNSIAEFIERMNNAESLVESQPGLMSSHRYDQHDDKGNLIVVTVATWADKESLEQARSAVHSEFKRIGFNPAEFYQRLNIRLERGAYNVVK
jgi:steroid delta-isomerase-like uncharacterized protein